MIRRTFLAIASGLVGVAAKRPSTAHIKWRVYWSHLRDNKYAVTIYLYGKNEHQPSLIFTNKGGEYMAWRLEAVCKEGVLTDPKLVEQMPSFIKDQLRTMTYGVNVILGELS